MKYEYCLYTWGGFYNEAYWGIHNECPGCHYFDSKEERELESRIYEIKRTGEFK